MGIGSERYVSVTTFTKSGAPKPAPVWIAELGDGTIGFTTGGDSWKVKRLRNTPRVTVQACNVRGVPKPGSEPVEGTAAVVSGDDYKRVASAIRRKYKLQSAAVDLGARLKQLVRPSTPDDTAIIITLEG